MKNLKKVISIIIIICTLLCNTQGITLADTTETSTEQSTQQTTKTNDAITVEDILAGVATWADIYTGIDTDTVPDAVGIEAALSKMHSERLYGEETGLNEVRFRNIDGSTTVYIFDYPVKYVDEYGVTCDVKLEIADTQLMQAPYSNSAGNAVTTFSRNISDGISLTDNEVSVTLLPILPTVSSSSTSIAASPDNITTGSTVKRVNNKTVAYTYDDKTTIEYELTYTGFKEDIVVSEYTGQTEYAFTLVTNGLFLSEKNGSFNLYDENGNIKAMLGDIIIFTADEKNNTLGSMTAQTIKSGEKYLLTIHVDAEFLSDEKTKYPIRIDPTIEINYDDYGSSAIEDVTINSIDTISGTSATLGVGKYGDDNSVSRILMKFPGLDLSTIPSAAHIESAKVEIRDLMCQEQRLGVYCHAFTGYNWSESTANWSNVSPDSYAAGYSFNNISYDDGKNQTVAHRYVFNISNAVIGWKNGNYYQNKGIIFKASAADEANIAHNYKTFASYNRSDYKPTFSMTYRDNWDSILDDDTYYINNELTGKYIYNDTGYAYPGSGLIADFDNTICWEVLNYTDGVAIRSLVEPTKYLGIWFGDTPTIELYSVHNSTVPAECMWNIEYGSNRGILISYSDVDYGAMYLCSSNNNILLTTEIGEPGSESYKSCTWRVPSTSYLGDTDSHEARELSANSYFNNQQITLPESKFFTLQKQYYKEIWTSPSDFTFAWSGNGNIKISGSYIYANTKGDITVTATHKVTGRVITFNVTVNALLIYQSAATEEKDEYDCIAEDLTCGDLTKDALLNKSSISESDIIENATALKNEWTDLCYTMTESGLRDVALGMINHFMNGSGDNYENETLTNAVLSHSNTQNYKTAVESLTKELITEYSGNITALSYDATDRLSNPLRNALLNNGITQPVYNNYSDGDLTNGLAFCLHDIWGNKIEITSYTLHPDDTYSCTLLITLYDHFGLDENDIQRGFWQNLAGIFINIQENDFYPWYILQHYDYFENAHKPFVTLIPISVHISGTLT